MDEARITRPSTPSTRTIVANEDFCKQVAVLLLCDRAPIHDAFVGEPVEEVLEMVRWALSHEDDEGFNTAEVLIWWAKERGRGAWSGRPRRPERDPYEELASALELLEGALLGDVSPTAGYASTSPTTSTTRRWLWWQASNTPTILEEGGRLSERLTDFQKLTDAVGLFRLRFSGASLGLFLSPE